MSDDAGRKGVGTRVKAKRKCPIDRVQQIARGG